MNWCTSTLVRTEGCFVFHTTRSPAPPLLLHIRGATTGIPLQALLAPDWCGWDTEANLLLWDPDLCAACWVSVVLATWGTGGRFEASLEERSWRRVEHVWCLMMLLRAKKAAILLNYSLSVIFRLVVCLQKMFCVSSYYKLSEEKKHSASSSKTYRSLVINNWNPI